MESLTVGIDPYLSELPANSPIAIINHPYGRQPGLWPFGQFWLWTHYPEKSFGFQTEVVELPDGLKQFVFTWDGSKIIPATDEE